MFNVPARKKKDGFSLIELVVAMGVMMVLSAGVMSQIGSGSQKYGRDTRRKSDLSSVASSLEIYRNDNAGYPPCAPVGAGCEVNSASIPGLANYLNSWPTDPLGATSRVYSYRPFDSGGGNCNGSASDRCVTYTLCTALEKVTTPVSATPACRSCGTFTCSFRLTNP